MPQPLPRNLYASAQVRELDRISIEDRGIAGIVLMRRAAKACVASLIRRWPRAKLISIFCGSGNNAGDGYLVAGLLAEKNYTVSVYIVGDQNKLSSDARRALSYCESSSAVLHAFGSEADIAKDFSAGHIDVIVDALLGIGVKGQLRANYQAAIQLINDHPAPVLAVDIPSGLNADTGQVLDAAVEADLTVSFIGLMDVTGFQVAIGSVKSNIAEIRQSIENEDAAMLDIALGKLDGNFKREIPDGLEVELGINFTDGD